MGGGGVRVGVLGFLAGMFSFTPKKWPIFLYLAYAPSPNNFSSL